MRGQSAYLVEGESKLKVQRLFRPERAVVVERSDAFFRHDVIRAAGARHARYKVDDPCFGRAIVPGGKRIIHHQSFPFRFQRLR